MRGGLSERAPGVWRLSISVGRDPGTRKRRRVFRTFHGTRREAERELTRLLRDADVGALADAGRMTLEEYLQDWLEHMQHRVRSNTFQRYASVVRTHIVPVIGSLELAKLRPLHIQALESRALERGRADGTGGLSARTVVHVHRVLSQALSQAVRWQLLVANPAQAVQPPRPGRPALTIPDAETVERIVRAAEGTHLHMPIVLAVATGMRRSEILGLRWAAVDLDEGIARVVATLHRVERGLDFAEPKTHRSRRSIMLPPFAVEVLRVHRKEQTERRLKIGEAWRACDLVITVIDGGPMDPSEITSGFKRIAARAGAPKVRFHDLRHAFATMLLASGVHPKIASEALGHSTVGITLDIYSHVLPSMQEEAARAIQKTLGGLEEKRSEVTPIRQE